MIEEECLIFPAVRLSLAFLAVLHPHCVFQHFFVASIARTGRRH